MRERDRERRERGRDKRREEKGVERDRGVRRE
jgi:hypothetical protein